MSGGSPRRSPPGPVARRLIASLSSPDMASAIERLCAEVLAGVTLMPTDLHALMARVGITSALPTDLRATGELRRIDGRLVIAYDVRQGPERLRFTLAHEIAHAVLMDRGIGEGADLERVCDRIATEILMPKRQFIQHLRQPLQLDQIFTLSRELRTSVTATLIRCCELTGAMAFGTAANEVGWTWGISKTALQSRGLTGSDAEVMDNASIGRVVMLPHRRPTGWRLQGRHVSDPDRGFFLLTPLAT